MNVSKWALRLGSFFVFSVGFASVAIAQNTESARVINYDSSASISLTVPRTGIQPSEIAVLINDQDPQSVQVAGYFQSKHNIPAANMIHVSFAIPGSTMDAARFNSLKSQVDAQLPSNIQ